MLPDPLPIRLLETENPAGTISGGFFMFSCLYDFVFLGVNKALLLAHFFYISIQTQHEETQVQVNKGS